MENIFDPASYPTVEPSRLVVGDRWAWRKVLVDYPATAYELSYEMVSYGNQQHRIRLTAAADGDDHIIEVESTATALEQAGRYRWASFLTRSIDSARGSFQVGDVTVAPDPAVDGSDPRSYWRQALDAIEAVLAGRLSREALVNYQIGGRSIAFDGLAELRLHRDYCAREVAREQREEAAARGQRQIYTVGVRL